MVERERAKQHLTFGQKTGLRSKPIDNLPLAVFDVQILHPSIAVIGQPLPASNPNHSSHKVQVFLRRETLICGIKHVSETRSHEQIGWINASVMVAQNFDKAMPTIERLDLRKSPRPHVGSLPNTFIQNLQLCALTLGQGIPHRGVCWEIIPNLRQLRTLHAVGEGP